ncbi:multi-sensor signal transduction histidine kinase [Pseudodesulfovibrio mercurii]|uniref:histidine kinase n=1 Tax=Pseudodesulfovibrio mercurii TaxID=641491 RepID=F0JKD5_9BACT|nr:PAS domain S-box protein [Pseudodesulfovibrio mercurii]EGB16384.1 multi-sensor signal transduction histidine kinase [Pseudodesulfovibrio mercurii]
MKGDERKTKAELIAELDDLRARFDSVRDQAWPPIADEFPLFIFEIDRDEIFRYANKHALETFGYDEEDLRTDLPLTAIIHPDSIRRARLNLARVLNGEDFEHEEYMAMRKDGSVVPIKTYTQPVRRDGQVVGLRGVVIDVSEIRQVEDALRSSETHYRILFETTGTAMVLLGKDATIRRCNSQFCLMSGCTREEIEGKLGWTDFVPPDEQKRMERFQEDRARKIGHPPSDYEFTFLTRDGVRRRIHLFVRNVPDTDDRVCSLIDVTERDEALHALRKSEERYQLMARGANDGLWDWYLASDECFYSPRYREILGYTEEEFPNCVDSWLKSLHPDDRERAMAANMRCIEGEIEQFQVEFRQIHKDGSIRWILGRGGSTLDENGKVYRLSGTHTDITQRKQAEDALRESEERFRLMIEHASSGIFQASPEGRFLTVNPALARMLGYDSPEDMVGNVGDIGTDILINDADRQAFLDGIYAQGELQNYEYHCRRKDGGAIWLAGNTRMVRAQDGAVAYFEGFLQDITARKLNERTTHALYAISTAVNTTRNLRDLYQTIHAIIGEVIEARNFFIAMLDEKNDMLRFVYFQDEMDDYFDIPNISDPGQSSLTIHVFRTAAPLYLSQADPGIEERLAAIGVIGTPPAAWLGVPLRQGERVVGAMAVQDYANPRQYSDEAATFLTAVSEQVAMAIERKTIEEALTRLNEELEDKVEQRTAEIEARKAELEEANRRLMTLDEIKSSMVSSVSHELRTPLTSIRGFAKLCAKDFTRHFLPLARGEQLSAKGRRIQGNLGIIDTEGERLTRLINDFLDINRIESGKACWNDDTLNPTRVIREAVASASGGFNASRSVELVTVLPETVRRIKADPDKIKQVLINLLNNAYKFTRQGRVTVALLEHAESLTVSVVDTGSGIPEDELNYIFEKFHKSRLGDTVRNEAQGTGLGLAICKEIVEHYGGTIRVQSTLGRGSVFTFTLPTVPADDNTCPE